MKRSVSVRQIILLLVFTLAAGTGMAQQAGGQRYIVILKSRSGPVPDLSHLGGVVTFRQDEELIVTFPPTALSLLEADPLVRYVQTLSNADAVNEPLMGEPAEPAAGNQRRLVPHATAGNQSWSRQYLYDPSGNITNINNGTNGGSQEFVYDELGRLKEMATDGTTTESYGYDRYGNQTSRTTSAGQQSMNTEPTTNRLSTGYSYDPAGNVTSGDNYVLSYDGLGQAATKTYTGTTTFNEAYIYSAGEERVGVQASSSQNGVHLTNWWYWSVRDETGKVLRQYRSSATDPTQPAVWIEDYVWRDGLLLGAERPSMLGGRRHFHLDHLGSPRLITSDAGQIISRHDYLPFGGESSIVGQETGIGFDREDPMQFTGHERDYAGSFGREDGHAIDYMHARYYSPALGRFLSVDPVLGKPQQPQSWNRYAYVMNNPLRYTDPDGREHIQEPGFTKPLSEADWSDAPSVIKVAFNVEGVLTSEAATEFLGGLFTTVSTVTRYMGKEEANAARDTGEIPNVGRDGKPRPTHVTTDKPVNGATVAQKRYEIELPSHRATVPKDRVPGRLKPAPDGRPTTSGHGSQSATNQPIPVRPNEIKPMNQTLWDKVASWFK